MIVTIIRMPNMEFNMPEMEFKIPFPAYAKIAIERRRKQRAMAAWQAVVVGKAALRPPIAICVRRAFLSPILPLQAPAVRACSQR